MKDQKYKEKEQKKIDQMIVSNRNKTNHLMATSGDNIAISNNLHGRGSTAKNGKSRGDNSMLSNESFRNDKKSMKHSKSNKNVA